jgi:hypothetical protein
MTAEPPNLDELARRYLDLWQDQVAAMSADPDVSRTMGRYAQLWATLGPAGLAGIWAAAAEGLKGGGPGANVFADGPFAEFFKHAAGPAAAAAAHGTAPAGAARGDRGDDMAELRRRLAVLEEKLASGTGPAAGAGLASKPEGTRGKPRKRARKPSGTGVP